MQQVEAGVVEVTELESWLDAECPCEFIHKTRTVCTVLVVALMVGCTKQVRVCQSAAIFKMESMKLVNCARCHLPAEDCWRIIPI